MDVKLVVVEGIRLGTVISVPVERFLIGRDSSCQLRPKSPTISHHHCVLSRRGDQVIIQDLGSTNGTLVNDHRLLRGEEVRVHNGDRLQVGQLIFAIGITDERHPPADDFPIDEWLATSTEADASRDASAETAIVASPFGRPSPAKEKETAFETRTIPRFEYRHYDRVRKVAIIGLSEDHLDEEGSLGVVRACLFEWAATPQYCRMILDLGAVESLSSAAFAFLLGLAHHCLDAGGELRLCSIPTTLKKKFESLKISNRIGCFADRTEAIDESWD